MIKRFCAWSAKLLSYIIFKLPIGLQLFLGDVLGVLWFDVFRIRRSLILSNLLLAFPEMSESQRIQLGRKSLCNMGRTFIEYFYFPFIKKSDVDRYFLWDGYEKLRKWEQQSQGICLLTCHLGSGDFGTAALALKGFPVHIISKEFKLSWLNELWYNLRKRLGIRLISSRHSSFQILRALKNKQFVIFVQDQFMGPPIGGRTTFFGKETGSALGLAVMAQKSRVPIIPIFTYRENRDSGFKHIIEVGDEIPWEEKETSEQTLLFMTQKFNDVIEKMIRLHPDQWMWVHRRWKKYKI